ncbi:hypothetical protein C8R43DRAFT_950452 [Mycena crocata]|nr:hypothetical protein C8R43DRAFT_950452 [Mycena crocata]
MARVQLELNLQVAMKDIVAKTKLTKDAGPKTKDVQSSQKMVVSRQRPSKTVPKATEDSSHRALNLKIVDNAVNVYWHVISVNSALSGGNIPDFQITNQINVLNTDYGAANIVWKLAGTTQTVNADWFNNAGPSTSQQTAMKNALRQGVSEKSAEADKDRSSVIRP